MTKKGASHGAKRPLSPGRAGVHLSEKWGTSNRSRVACQVGGAAVRCLAFYSARWARKRGYPHMKKQSSEVSFYELKVKQAAFLEALIAAGSPLVQRLVPLRRNITKAPFGSGWNQIDPVVPEVARAMARAPENGGFGVLLGSHCKTNKVKGGLEGVKRFDGPALVAFDLDFGKTADSSEALRDRVLGMVANAAGVSVEALPYRGRAGSLSRAVLAFVDGLELQGKQAFTLKDGGAKDVVEVLAQGFQCAAFYLHESGLIPEWFEGGAPSIPKAVNMPLEAFRALCDALRGMSKEEDEAKKKKATKSEKRAPGRPKNEERSVWTQERLCSRPEEDPVWQAVRAAGLVKEELADGVLRIECPFGSHGGADSKTEFFWHGFNASPRGFKCFADQCDGARSVGDLIGWLETGGHLKHGWRRGFLPPGFVDGDRFGDESCKGWICYEKRDRFGASVVPLVLAPFESRGWLHGEGLARRCVVRGVCIDGKTKELIVPFGGDPKALWKELCDVGGLLTHAFGEEAAKKLHELVGALSNAAGCRAATKRPGWQFKNWTQGTPYDPEEDGAPVFLWPDGEAIAADDSKDRAPVLLADTAIETAQKGTLESWRAQVAPLVRLEPKAMLALSVPFYAAIARLMGWPGGALFLVGPSSRGKTTLLNLAASVDGVRADGSNETANFAMSKLLMNFDVASTCDDLKNMKGALKDYAFLFNGDGRGRQRATSDGVKTEEKLRGCPVVIGTSEKSFVELYREETGRDPLVGEEVRVLSMAALLNYGVFSSVERVEELEEWQAMTKEQQDTTDKGAFLSEKVLAACKANKGAVGRAYRLLWAQEFEACKKEVERLAFEFKAKAAGVVALLTDGESPDGAGGRVLGRLARHCAALCVANDRLHLGLGPNDVILEDFAREAAQHVVALRLYGEQGSELFRIKEKALKFFEVNKSKFAPAWTRTAGTNGDGVEKDRVPGEELGVFFKDYSGIGPCYFVKKGQAQALAEKLGVPSERFIEAMQKAGCYVRPPAKDGRARLTGGRSLGVGFFLKAEELGGLRFDDEKEAA